MVQKRPPLVILAGPTAVGKTKLSVSLAKQINGEIISADSMQVYKFMDIGSAKVTKEEADGILHYGIDVLEPTEDYNVHAFQSMAKDALKKIYEKGKIPILVGGTGFYIQSVLYDIDFTENETSHEYRTELEQTAKEKGNLYLHEMLRNVDPVSAETIHPNNVKRVIRALEFYRQTGEEISTHNETERQKKSPYQYAFFVLTDERNLLYERIDKRVDLMMKEGLVAEVNALKEMGLTRDNVSMKGLGYKEILDALDENISMEEAVYIIKRDTRHFAKRQLTWFKREKEVIWVNRSDFSQDENQILTFMTDVLKEKEILGGK